jgi:hypothetical protein
LKDVKALQTRIEKGQLKKADVIERKIGSLQKKHPKVNRYYTLTLRKDRLVSERNESKLEEAISLCGDYVLKTDKDMPADQLWQLYMTLLKAEAGFRMLKSSLGLRPNYHQLEGRVDAHIFISVLAYHLLSWVRHRLEASGDTRDWQTIRRLLSTHSLASTLLPLEDGRVLQIRKPSVPDPEQTSVFQKLGIDWKTLSPCTKSITKSTRLCSAFESNTPILCGKTTTHKKLGLTCDPWLHKMTNAVGIYFLLKKIIVLLQAWARANDTHLSLEDIKKLWHLIQ